MKIEARITHILCTRTLVEEKLNTVSGLREGNIKRTYANSFKQIRSEWWNEARKRFSYQIRLEVSKTVGGRAN